MSELNPKMRDQVEGVLNQSFAHPRAQFVALLRGIMEGRITADRRIWRKAAVLYAQAADKLPLCFWAQILDIAIEKTDHVFHTSPCQHYDGENYTCLLGHPESECTRDCQLYEGETEQHCDDLDCNEECTEDFGEGLTRGGTRDA